MSASLVNVVRVEIERDICRTAMIEEARKVGRLESELREAIRQSQFREARIARLVDAATSASATLSHAYNTVLNGQLAEDALLSFEELDRAIAHMQTAGVVPAPSTNPHKEA